MKVNDILKAKGRAVKTVRPDETALELAEATLRLGVEGSLAHRGGYR